MSTNVVNLSILEPGKLPLEVFNEIARLTVTPVLELIITDRKAVLLNKRLSTDQYWPNQYCMPGSIIYPGGPESLKEYVDKILLKIGISNSTDPRLIGIELCSTERGKEIAIIYRIDVNSIPELNDHLCFVELNDLGTIDTIPEHLEILQKYLIG